MRSEKLRSVNTKFWDDTFISELNPSEKLLFLYLLTNSLANILGIYEITIKRISYDTGLTKETIAKGLESFAKGRKAFHTDDNYIIMPNWLKNQRLNTNMKVAVAKEFNALPKHIKDSILSNGSAMLPNDSEGFRMVMECLDKYEIEIEEEIEGEERKDLNISFSQFWDLYDKKVGDRTKCEKKWIALTDADRQKIIDTLPLFKSSIRDKQFQPHPKTYLNQKRWNDEIEIKEDTEKVLYHFSSGPDK